MIRKTCLTALLYVLAACETVPVEMAPDAFDAVMSETAASASLPYVERRIAEALDDPDLSAAQRHDLLKQRAEKRIEHAYDVPGAITDLDTILATASETMPFEELETQKSRGQVLIEEAQVRLSRLQNLSDWFDDKVTLGALDEAATRYQRSRLTPTAEQTYVLREAGFVCAEGDGASGEMFHTFGAAPDYAAELVWCDALPDS
ncbi:MAG: hypothetical protein QNI84_07335 [Henriciella sp.]|nr:hypothetical protein [Henriciella sp.]